MRIGSEQIPKEKLVLTPMMPMNNIGTKASGLSCSFGIHKAGDTSMEFFGVAPTKPPLACKDPESYIMAAFWWVATTSDKDDANMEMHQISVNGCKIPIMKNSKAIPPCTKLRKFQAAPAVVKASSLTIVPTASAEKPPAKKARKSTS